MTATKVGSETVLARIVQLVGEAQRSRAPVQRLADAVAAWFVPAVVVVAVLTFVVVGRCSARRRRWRTPWSTRSRCSSSPARAPWGWPRRCRSWSASAAARREGVLIRSAEVLERMEKVDTVVVDKTGTLTEGKPRLVDGRGRQRDSARRTCCGSPPALEQGSEHPLAAAIVAGAQRPRRRPRDGRGLRVRRRARASAAGSTASWSRSATGR